MESFILKLCLVIDTSNKSKNRRARAGVIAEAIFLVTSAKEERVF